LGLVNAFLLDDNGLTLVDTGYKGNLGKIFRMIAQSGMDPYKIKQLILTHCHPDHAGSAAVLKRMLDIPVFAHVEEVPLLTQGISGRFPQQRTPGLMNWMVYNAFIKHADKTNEPLQVEEAVVDNDVLPIMGGVQVIHTPGHSAGHIALLLQAERLLIAGDSCANMGGLGLSTVYEDRKLGIASIRKTALLPFDKAVFGHGKPIHQMANRRMEELVTTYHNDE